jgi:hypothetical protein
MTLNKEQASCARPGHVALLFISIVQAIVIAGIHFNAAQNILGNGSAQSQLPSHGMLEYDLVITAGPRCLDKADVLCIGKKLAMTACLSMWQ